MFEKKLILTFVEMVRKIFQDYLNKGITVKERHGDLNSEYGKDSWGFIVKNRMRWSVDGKLLREDSKGREILAKPT